MLPAYTITMDSENMVGVLLHGVLTCYMFLYVLIEGLKWSAMAMKTLGSRPEDGISEAPPTQAEKQSAAGLRWTKGLKPCLSLGEF